MNESPEKDQSPEQPSSVAHQAETPSPTGDTISQVTEANQAEQQRRVGEAADAVEAVDLPPTEPPPAPEEDDEEPEVTGLTPSQAQAALEQMAQLMKERGVEVSFPPAMRECEAGEREEIYVVTVQGPGLFHPQVPKLLSDPFALSDWALIDVRIVEPEEVEGRIEAAQLVWRRIVNAGEIERRRLVRQLPVIVPTHVLEAQREGRTEMMPDADLATPPRPAMPFAHGLPGAVAPPRPAVPAPSGQPTVARSAPGAPGMVQAPQGGLTAEVSVRQRAEAPPPISQEELAMMQALREQQAQLPAELGPADTRIPADLQFSVRPQQPTAVLGGAGAAVVRPSSVAAPPLPPRSVLPGTPPMAFPAPAVPQVSPVGPLATPGGPVAPPAAPQLNMVPGIAGAPAPPKPVPEGLEWLRGGPASQARLIVPSSGVQPPAPRLTVCRCVPKHNTPGQLCGACGLPVITEEQLAAAGG